jgi:mono/diheme cytochrome c family protein
VAFAVLAVSLVAWTGSSAAANPTLPTTTSTASTLGRQLYRRYCGQCHALAKALSAGFGNNTKGIGRNGGPSFNDLRVSYAASVTAVTEPTGGHEKVRTMIPAKQLIELATYIARTTAANPIPALSTDG